MKSTDIFKVLANDVRYQILLWLKDPATHFGADALRCGETGFDGGICVGVIADKSGLAQSVISSYLGSLQQTGLIESKRLGKWTYYRYCPSGVDNFIRQVRDEIGRLSD
ncbi:DNA-binding transcriptional repressor ArsR [Moraxella caprae]|uniref:DNA-binding transcriptional repressor ArsR n=1 Tax=Moraxella caprae TaxID=90240 RepID=A0A378QYM9_9GAMM|nr:helix-turn-helix transcriptional regulator [Moraxella caprae]STZ07567.1 DNA-binding transcriptional repressor ArsR [Moraxella caprae]